MLGTFFQPEVKAAGDFLSRGWIMRPRAYLLPPAAGSQVWARLPVCCLHPATGGCNLLRLNLHKHQLWATYSWAECGVMTDACNKHPQGGCLVPRHPALRRPLLGHLEMSCVAQGTTTNVLKSQQGSMMTHHGSESGARLQPKSKRATTELIFRAGLGERGRFWQVQKHPKVLLTPKEEHVQRPSGCKTLQLQLQALLLIITISQLTLVENAWTRLRAYSFMCNTSFDPNTHHHNSLSCQFYMWLYRSMG